MEKILLIFNVIYIIDFFVLLVLYNLKLKDLEEFEEKIENLEFRVFSLEYMHKSDEEGSEEQ